MSLNIVDTYNNVEVRTVGTGNSYQTVIIRPADGFVSLSTPASNEDAARSNHALTLNRVHSGKQGVFDTVITTSDDDTA